LNALAVIGRLKEKIITNQIRERKFTSYEIYNQSKKIPFSVIVNAGLVF